MTEMTALNFAKLFFQDCEDLSNQLIITAQNWFAANADDIAAKRRLKDIEEKLTRAEAEIVAEAAMEAVVGKTGPLAGFAATSPAYKSACEALIGRERERGGKLANLYAAVIAARNIADECQQLREGTGKMLEAQKAAADLRASMLRPLGR